jgi:hypothetical protein
MTANSCGGSSSSNRTGLRFKLALPAGPAAAAFERGLEPPPPPPPPPFASPSALESAAFAAASLDAEPPGSCLAAAGGVVFSLAASSVGRELGSYPMLSALLRRLEFQWFLIALSVRPLSSLAISAHLFPILA